MDCKLKLWRLFRTDTLNLKFVGKKCKIPRFIILLFAWCVLVIAGDIFPLENRTKGITSFTHSQSRVLYWSLKFIFMSTIVDIKRTSVCYKTKNAIWSKVSASALEKRRCLKLFMLLFFNILRTAFTSVFL